MITASQRLIRGLAYLALGAYIHREGVAQGTTAFTFQGQLRDGGTNANGAYTLVFKLFDSASGGGQIGVALTNGLVFSNGLYSTSLDFGPAAFGGKPRWLDVTVQGGSGAPESLSPRVQILPVPYALYSGIAATVADPSLTINAGSGLAGGGPVSLGGVTTLSLKVNGNSSYIVNAIPKFTSVSALGYSSLADDGTVVTTSSGLRVTGTVRTSAFRQDAGIEVYSTNFPFLTLVNAIADPTIPGTECSIDASMRTSAGDQTKVASWNGRMIIKDQYANVGAFTLNTYGGNGTSSEFAEVEMIAFYKGGISVFGDANYFSDAPGLNVFRVKGTIKATNNVEAQMFITTSDKALKEQFAPVNCREILDRVDRLPIFSWAFKSDRGTRHVGPTAQDFSSAFHLGTDDKHIATVDESGVALAAIQGLNERIRERDGELEKLRLQNEALASRLNELERLVKVPGAK